MDKGGDEAKTERISLLWARAEHAAEIVRLHATLFDTAWNTAAIEPLIGHPGSIGLVALLPAPAAMVGFALAQVAADEAEILTLGVQKEWQRKGIATRFVDGLLRAGRNAGARSIFLDVAEGNAAALGLYRKAGFIEVSRRKGYYARLTGAEDAIQLRAQL